MNLNKFFKESLPPIKEDNYLGKNNHIKNNLIQTEFCNNKCIKNNIQRVICGDNLEVLKTLEDESIDLCYIDPPFFSGRNYAIIFGDEEEIRQFDDRWVKMNETGKYTKDINVYLNWIEPRIKEIYRILKPTGSFYLHCDWHAGHYLKVTCDNIFGYDKFKTEIKWKKATGGKFSSQYWDSVDDTILM